MILHKKHPNSETNIYRTFGPTRDSASNSHMLPLDFRGSMAISWEIMTKFLEFPFALLANELENSQITVSQISPMY